MASVPHPRIRPGRRHSPGEPTLLLPIKVPPDLRKDFRMMAVNEDMTYAQLLRFLVDERNKTLERQRRGQVHPFHRPRHEPEETVTL